MIFVDTSFLFAAASKKDKNHQKATDLFARAIKSGEELVMHNYIVVESLALFDRRLGRAMALEFIETIGEFGVYCLSPEEHGLAILEFSERTSRQVSFVDVVSFMFMRSLEIEYYLGFDADFEKEGFKLFK